MDTTNNTNQTESTSTDITIPEEVRQFLNGILDDAKMMTLDDNMREEMIKELFARLDSFLTSRIVENMPPEHMDEFMKLVDEKKSQDTIQKFIQEKMPNSPDIFALAFADFREMYLYNNTVGRKLEGLKEEKDSS